jgi:hypothetical protein
VVRVVIAALIALGVAGLVGACGTDAVGVDACRQIETARCQQAVNCPAIDLGRPVPVRSSDPVGECIRFYHDACLHGLEVADPGAVQTKACVDAINQGDCTVVNYPETDPNCRWLKPPAPPPPAVDAGDAGDAANAADAPGSG